MPVMPGHSVYKIYGKWYQAARFTLGSAYLLMLTRGYKYYVDSNNLCNQQRFPAWGLTEMPNISSPLLLQMYIAITFKKWKIKKN